MFEITFPADSNGSVSPILEAFSLNALRISGDILMGLNILLSIVFTSTADNLPVAVLNSSSLMFNVLAASISFLNSLLTLNKDLFAFIYESTISRDSIGPPRKASLVNNDRDSLTPLW